MDASVSVRRDVEDLRSAGPLLLAGMGSPQGSPLEALGRIEAQLGGSQDLAAMSVVTRARGLADAAERAAEHVLQRDEVDALLAELPPAVMADEDLDPQVRRLLLRALWAPDQAALDALLAELIALDVDSPEVDELSVGERGIFLLRGRELALRDSRSSLESELQEGSIALGESTDILFSSSGRDFLRGADAALLSFGGARTKLYVLAFLGILLAAGSSLVLVEFGLIRRIRVLTGAAGLMARGEAADSIPALGGDELDELAVHLEEVRRRLP